MDKNGGTATSQVKKFAAMKSKSSAAEMRTKAAVEIREKHSDNAEV